jgi:hypothetical protein
VRKREAYEIEEEYANRNVMMQVSDILFSEMGVGVGRKSVILLEGSQVSSAHILYKISMKIKTINSAKVRTDCTDANFYLLLNAEVRDSGKKETVRWL